MVVSWVRRLVAGVVSAGLVVVGAVAGGPAAVADVAPVAPTPPTVSAQALPTVQVDGVVWKQLIVGDRVYVGGNFTSARPAGAAAGVGEVSRSYLLAYDLASGELVGSFAPVLDAQVKDMALSPDGSTLYVVGNFTHVDGLARYRIAAFDTASGELVSGFAPYSNAPLTAVAASSSAVYFSGTLTNVNGVPRSGVGAVDAASGAVLPFAPSPAGGKVQAIVVSDDGSQLMLGGAFTSMNGSSSPGYGLARFSSDGTMLPLSANAYIRNGGTGSAVLDMESDGTQVYGAGYLYGGGGNVEGTFAISWATGALVWVEDCHGDTYSVAASGDAVYAASHKHYCGNSGGFPQTTPWTYHRGTATGKTADGVNTPDIYGYPDHDGEPKPELLYWFPEINAGTFTGLNQGPWTVEANDQYVLYGGEFTQVDGMAQQGLVRFASTSVTPSTDGPKLTGGQMGLTAVPIASDRVKVSWLQNWDMDDETLTYKLYRGSVSPEGLVWSQTVTAPFWMPGDTKTGYVDTGLTPGSDVRYRLQVVDSQGNTATSDFVSVTVGGIPASAYADAVQADGPRTYWRLGDAPGSSTAVDWQSDGDAIVGTGVSFGAAGAIDQDPSTAAQFNGTSTGIAVSPALRTGPQVFSVELWFATTSTAGGRIIGYSNRTTGTSTHYDRHVYMTADGRVNFGVYSAGTHILTSPASYNDGQWHQVVATLGPGGQTLYIDGQKVAANAGSTAAEVFDGYWRMGGDSTWGGAQYFAGLVDEVSIYDTVLAPEQVAHHHELGVQAPSNQSPVASATVTQHDLTVHVDGSASSDADGTIASYAWDFGDGTTATGSDASHTYQSAGDYLITLVVTDDDGATGAWQQQVAVTEPPPPEPGAPFAGDVFDRSVSGGWGTADAGGEWTVLGGSSRFVVEGSAGVQVLSPGYTTTAVLSDVESLSSDVQVVVSTDVAPDATAMVYLQGRRVSWDAYSAQVKLKPDGSVQLFVSRPGGAVGGPVSGLTYAAGDALHLRVQVEGSSPTVVRAKVWKDGEVEPSEWMSTMTDSTASLQVPGAVGVSTYLSSSTTNGPVRFSFDDLQATTIQ